MLHYDWRCREQKSRASVQKANADEGNATPGGAPPVEGGPPVSGTRTGLEVLGRQFSRFLAVGVVTTAVHYGVLIALVEAFDINPVLGTTAGFIAAVFVS